jgi:predicted aminopeptidase
VKGQAGFNEELAEFTGGEGARLYMVSRFGADSEEYQSMLISEDENKKYIDFIRQLIVELDALYSSSLGREEKLKEKERLITGAKERFAVEYGNLFLSDNYQGFSDLPINNAYLELYRLYYADDSFFADLYERSGRNLPAFIAAAKTITPKDGDPRERLESRLLQAKK